MSVVTNIILKTAAGDVPREDASDGINPAKALRFGLVRVDPHAGGTKAMECDIYMSAVNYVDLGEIVDWFTGSVFEFPESAQLFLMEQEDDLFAVIYLARTPRR